ncbi:uncharacterized protein [Arachis hypogaea]|uniref:uncharacterized protein n=1 Tax=Arachis hypogaea TaxID=3818 RepID=UPI000DECF9DE|nr:uncharacterized protein LOC112701442 [Arachis hypogaea]
MRYDGTKDPQEHLTAFEARMNLEGVGDAVSSVHDTHSQAKHPINLLRVTQKLGEPTRKFLDRFNDECLDIDGFTDSVASLCLTNDMLNKDFRKHLTTKPVWTMQEIQSVAKEYINDEKASRVVAANKRQPKQPPQVGRFTNYTPLTVPIVEVYQQIADKRILSRPRPLKERTRGNKSLYCDYHKEFSHKTQNCFDLKDALEQAIREGKLSEFSHLIWEPRRRERERSEEDHSRTIKQRQEPIGNADNPPTFVVNIVVERGTPQVQISSKKGYSDPFHLDRGSHRSKQRTPYDIFRSGRSMVSRFPRKPPMVVTTMVGTGLVRRILVDTEADSNILFRNVFDAMGLKESDLKNHQHGVMGLGDNYIKPDGTICLPICLGAGDDRRLVMADFVVFRDSTAYNIILGRKTINEFSVATCTKFLTMKFVTDKGTVGSIRGDLEAAVAYDNASLSLRKESKKAARVFLADLDVRMEDKPTLEPEGDMEKF